MGFPYSKPSNKTRSTPLIMIITIILYFDILDKYFAQKAFFNGLGLCILVEFIAPLDISSRESGVVNEQPQHTGPGRRMTQKELTWYPPI